MYGKNVLVAVAAFACVATASPVEPRGVTQRVTQVKAQMKFKNGAMAREAAYGKYHAAAPPDVVRAAQAAQVTGHVTATPEQYDESYLCPVTVGSNTLMLDFDTGSADLWVFSTELPSSQSKGHTLYQCTGTKVSGYKWKITYGDGSGAAGNVFRDKVVIGAVTATSQAVEAATSVSSTFVSDTKNDGLVGLAFSSINMVTPVKQDTFFENVQSSLSAPLFTAILKHQAAGEYDFGYIDSSKYTGSIVYVSVNTENGFWQFTAGGYSVGSGAEKSDSLSCIADTGTSLILIADGVVSAYYAQVSGASYSDSEGGYIFPCSASLPTFSIYIGGQKRTVPGSYMNYAPLGNGDCYGGIQSSDGIGFNVLGDVFLKSQFVVFSATGPQLGFAQQA